MHLIIERLLDHNEFATRTLLAACRSLSEAQFHQRFEIGLGSLHDTLRHVLGAMLRWSDRITQRELRPSIEKSGRGFTPDELLQLLQQADREMRSAAETVERKLDQKFTVAFTLEMAPEQFTFGSAIVHVATHGVHHRAQCLNMLRQLGVQEPPSIDALDAELEAK